MKAHQWLAVFALSSLAAPEHTNLLPSQSNRVRNSGGFDIDPALSNKTALGIIPDNYDAVKRRDLVLRGDILKRQAPTSPSTMSADGASQIKVSGGKQGVLYHGDSRPPAEVFKSGFTPQGGDTNLQHHLSFTGNSAFTSVTRSPQSAERYAFGWTGAQKHKGYIYVIAPKDVPRGYWVPGIYPSDRVVINNQEFAVQGAVTGSSIVHAYEVPKRNPSDRSVTIKNENYVLKKSPGCLGLKSKPALCDPAKGENGRSGPKVSKSSRFRVAKSVGKSVAFMAVVPYARDLLNLLKQWDNPIGHAVKWFDDAITSLEEVIGGPQRKDIYGNELQGRIIDALKSISLDSVSGGTPCPCSEWTSTKALSSWRALLRARTTPRW
ncbi:uncharacterized protein G6M90_00g111960 [Metarhizium brunneum]|uniref:Pierisin-like domain-containing protein n=1 Tax=Metarhizium brunneum TaxID=500148 RepID=A0A7D5V4D0_9HYPO